MKELTQIMSEVTGIEPEYLEFADEVQLIRPSEVEEIVGKVLEGIFWNDEMVIDFVNWYLDFKKLPFRYHLENQTIIDEFKSEKAR